MLSAPGRQFGRCCLKSLLTEHCVQLGSTQFERLVPARPTGYDGTAVTKSHGLFPAASSSKKRYSARWLRRGFAVQVVRAEGGGGGAEESPHGGVERERLRVAPGEVISERLLERPQWAARFPLAYRNSAEQQSRHQKGRTILGHPDEWIVFLETSCV